MIKLKHKDMPEIVRIELTNTCNLECPHCRHHASDKKRTGDYHDYYKTPIHMTEEQVAAIIDEIAPYKPSVTLNVANEPLIAPAFAFAVKRIKEKGLSGTFNSNGLKLTEDVAKLLVDTQFDSVNISVDALTPETLKLARGFTKIDLLVKNVETLLRIRGNRQYPRVGVTFVKTDYNSHEIEGFLDFWKQRVDVIRVTGYISDLKPDVTKFGATKEELGNRMPCKQLFRDIVIRANGDCTPCVITSEQPDIVIGNLWTDGGVHGVWNGNGLNRLRMMHNGGDWGSIPFCRGCDYWVESNEMKEERKDGFLIRTPSPYTTFYNVESKLANWNRDLHDRQGISPANINES